MSDTIEALKTGLGVLPERDRAELAHFLIDSLGDGEEGAGSAWEAEWSRPVVDIRSGRVLGKPASQVFAELRKRLPRSRPVFTRRPRRRPAR